MAKILLTEDDEAVRLFVARALQMDGHTVVTADDGEEGYDRLVEHDGNFDLLLTDIKMPFMDGIELTRSAIAQFPHLKILMMTGYADQRERTDGLDEIVIDVVSKPFTLDQIRKSVLSAINDDQPKDSAESDKPDPLRNGLQLTERDSTLFSSDRKASA